MEIIYGSSLNLYDSCFYYTRYSLQLGVNDAGQLDETVAQQWAEKRMKILHSHEQYLHMFHGCFLADLPHSKHIHLNMV